jgi:hypothetical protein
MQVFKIVPTVQQYDWGKIGTSSKVAVFAQSAGISEFRVDGSKPYAEVSVSGDKPSCLVANVTVAEAVDGYTPQISFTRLIFWGNTGQLSCQEQKPDWRKGLSEI